MITNLLIKDSSDDEPNGKGNTITTGAITVLDTDAPSTLSLLKSRVSNYWQGFNLRRKAKIVALIIGLVPVATVGAVAHHLATQSLMTHIIRDQEGTALEIGQKVKLVTNHLISDINAMAKSPILADPELSKVATVKQKTSYLNGYITTHHEKYDSIAVFDTNGKLLFQSKSTNPLSPEEDYGTREYFQRAVSSRAATINSPNIHGTLGNTLEVASPIIEEGTGKIIGVLCARMPLSHWQGIFEPSMLLGFEHKLIDSNGQVFVSDETELVGKNLGIDFKDLPELQARLRARISNSDRDGNIHETRVLFDGNDRENALVTLVPIRGVAGMTGPGWDLAISSTLSDSFAPLRKLSWSLVLGMSAAALLVGKIATVVGNRATLPVFAALGAVKKIGQGDFSARLDVKGEDELAMLGTDINKMAQQLESLVGQKETEVLRSGLLKDLTLKLAGATNSKAVFQVAVAEMIPILRVDRAFIYWPKQGGQGEIVAESVKDERVSKLGAKISQMNYLNQYLVDDLSERVRVVDNIYQADLKLPDLRQLEAFEVKSELFAPLFVGQDFQGFIVVHQCDRLRTWKQAEIDFFAQIASQIMLAKERTDLIQEQKTAKEQLQKQALSLLMEVEPISKGDLTIRATVAEGEIGTLADSYNSTVENLRQIVTQVQTSVTQMAATTNSNEEIAQALSERAVQQSEAMASALQQIQAMTESIQAVARHAELVERSFQEVSDTVAVGNKGMERSVEGIVAIRETVADTAKKVKRLGESSQKISKVVNLISSFADRTNLLALNASLEANRAGQEGQTFAIVAEEVQTMAKQSAEATTEIEKLVASIQLNTKEVVAAMEQGTEQVVAGTKLVDETRQKLNQIAASSNLVGDRLKKITVETVQQSQVSQEISETIAEVAKMATVTSKDAIEVSASTRELLGITDELQTSAKKFKV